jgi:peptidoglycan/LPS O-acetylase OafA/YrhL
MQTDATPKRSVHFRGLDSLRFVAAGWVALSHGAGLPLKGILGNRGPIGHAVASIHGVLFNGVAAVAVFFVISGFCIHLPCARERRLSVRPYLIRRYVRIGGPLLAALAVMHLTPEPIARAGAGVLWSVYCELIYYTLYPLLFALFLRYGIPRIVSAATLVAGLLLVMHSSYLRPWEFGIEATWLIGLPSWLLGCLMADRARRWSIDDDRIAIWPWRVGAWLYSAAALAAVFHAPVPVGFPATSLIFAFYCYPWLSRELKRYRIEPPVGGLEWAGTWSYSLYLTHAMVIAAFSTYSDLPPLMAWIVELVAIVSIAYSFHLCVERPSHALARRLGRLAAAPALPLAPSVEPP